MSRRFLTFDCYGTLVDWKSGIERELTAALGHISLQGRELLSAYVDAERKQESGYKRYRQVLRDTAMSMSAVLGKEVDAKSAEEFAGSVPRWPVFPDTGRFLRDMGSLGYKRYILSNVDDDLLEETIGRNHLEVDGFVTAEQVGGYKPRPEHWMEFMSRTGASREDTLHVAQSVFHDILPAGELGIGSAWVNRYGERLPGGAFPKFISDSLESLGMMLR